MSQSRKQSMIEVGFNTGIGMLGSWAITVTVLFLVHNKWLASVLTVVLCTVWSLIRGYHIRRHFNNRLKNACQHQKYYETRACDAICTDCGKNIGFIQPHREKNPDGEIPTEGY